jgi:tetratricopeptide (TPR) repeat protein
MRRYAPLALIVVIAVMLPMAAVLGYVWSREPAPQGQGVHASESALMDLERLIKMEPANANSYRLLATMYQALNQPEEAEAVWHRAETANPGQVWPLVELGKMYEAAGLLVKARDVYYQAAMLNPQDDGANQLLQRSTTTVAAVQAIRNFQASQMSGAQAVVLDNLVLVNQALHNGWTYLGYVTDQDLLISGEETAVWHFWRAPTSEVKPTLSADSWQPVAPGIWTTMSNTSNMLMDGNFEQPLAGNNPQDFPEDIYSANRGTRQLRRVERAGNLTTAAALINDDSNRNTSYASSWKPIAVDSAYVVGADTFRAGGTPLLGWRWRGSLPVAFRGQEYSSTPGGSDKGWQWHASLAAPPPGADSIQMWLLNPNTSGAAYFDDAFLFQTPLPAPLYPGVLDREAERRQTWEELSAQYAMYPEVVDDTQWQSALVQNGPLTLVDKTLNSGWTLQGYSANAMLLAEGVPTLLVVYWRGPVGAVAGTSEAGWIDLYDGSWLQIIPDATNLLFNGTFENGLTGWEMDMASAESSQLQVMQRNGFTTTVGVLTNTLSFSNTSMLSTLSAVPSSTIYLQGGWMYGGNGRGYIGLNWQGDFGADAQTQDSFIAGAQAPITWSHYVGAAEPVTGTTGVQVWLLNYLSTGASAFDNLTLVPISAPHPVTITGVATVTDTLVDPEAAAPGANSASARQLLYAYQDDPSMLEDEAWLANLAATGPALAVNQEVDGGWTLLGMTADEEALAAGAITTVFYFWHGPVDAIPGSAEEGWYSIDVDTWLQIEDGAASLLPNGNFEMEPREAEATGFPLDYASGEPAGEYVQSTERNGAATRATVLAHAGVETSGITSDSLAVDPQRAYLQTGWLRSTAGGSGVMGVQWAGEDLPEEIENPALVVDGADTQEWEQFSRLLTAPANATSLQVLAYNLDAPGVVEIDDMLILPVPLPASAAPAVGMIPDQGCCRVS